MSIRASNWAWMIQLSPAPKIVLLALADIADDAGVCYPSISHIAKKACLGERAVQRRLAELRQLRLLSVQRRFRKDGSPTSNLYSLHISMSAERDRGGVEMTPPPVAASQDDPDESPPGDGSADVRTDNNTCSKSLLTPSVGVDASICLVFPKAWPREMIDGAVRVLRGIPSYRAQVLIDELVSRSQVGSVSRPLSYLRALAKSERAGSFIPELAHRALAARTQLTEQADTTESRVTDRSIAHDAIREARALIKRKKSPVPPSTHL
jgi:hypothetical protein